MKKSDVKDFDTLEEYYDKVRKIKFDDNVQIESLDDIYNNLFTLHRVGFSQRPTFFSRGKLQCSSGRFRSIDDFVKLVKKYFPDKTLKEIFQYLKDKEDTFKKDDLIQSFRYCGTIRKYNFSGLIPSRYSQHMEIEKYRLRDLNPNLGVATVADLLT
jgi:hypothetical protein